MPEPFKYHAFISYSHQDSRWGDWLHKALETYPIPKRLVGRKTAAGAIPKRLAPIFRDRDELPSAHDLGSKVEQALAQSAALIVICSPRSASSRWVNEEVTVFKRMGHADRVFCLIVDGEPNASDVPGREAEECFAPALRFVVDTHGTPTTQRAEPIAADARPRKDGKAGAKLKLLSGLLDVGFDELRQREQQRRVRRLTAIAALALVMMTVTSVLAVQAVIARKAADVARAAAERRQQQSEDLIGYMLGDLNDKLKGVGRLDIMQGVADKAMAYFAALPTADVTDTSLAQRATALQKIGGVRMDQGQTPAALAAYRAAADIEAERLRREPGDVEREIAYADSLKWVGNANWFMGDLEQAGQQFRTAGDTLQRAVNARPDDSELAFQFASARNNLGKVLEARGDYAGANRQYRTTLQIFQGLHRQHPDVARWQEEEGYAHNSLGKLALEQGDLEQAIARYLQDWQLKAALVAREPDNQPWRSDLAFGNAFLAAALGLAGQTGPASTHAAEAVEIGLSLGALDPENAAWQDYLALYRIRLAGLLRQQGQLQAAGEQLGGALQILRTLVAKDPANADWPQDLAKAQLEGARLALASDQTREARRQATATLATLQPLLAKRADDRTTALIATRADCLLGDLADADRDSGAAQTHWRAARDRIMPLARAGGNPELLDAWAGALLRLGERQAAEPLVARLQRMGYRDPDFVSLLRREGIAYPPNTAFQQRIKNLLQ